MNTVLLAIGAVTSMNCRIAEDVFLLHHQALLLHLWRQLRTARPERVI